MTIYYHPYAHCIQFIYLEFQDPQKAEAVFRDRKTYELKLENFDVCIQTLNENLLRKSKQFPYPQNVICIIKPLTTLEIIDEIPASEDYINKVSNLIESITQLKKQDILIQEDVNPLTKGSDDRHLFLTFPDKIYADKVYHSQPFFGCLLAHKMIHRIICPFLRYSTEACLMCSNAKNKKCVFDLCSECCVRQRNKGFECYCTFKFTPKKEFITVKNESNGEEKVDFCCVVCKENLEEDCANRMCLNCCVVQCRKLRCKTHEESFFNKSLRNQYSYFFFIFSPFL